MTSPEHIQQATAIQYMSLRLDRYPLLDLVYAIPNGGKRDQTTARKMRAEGQKAGMPDLCLPVARMGFHALYVEMKVEYNNGKKNTTSEAQKRKIAQLTEQGNLVMVCYTWTEAVRVIGNYLGYEGLVKEIDLVEQGFEVTF